jgi:hypothetical protein
METGWLAFWRVKAGQKVDPPATYDALQEGKQPAALEDVPVDDILAEIKRRYPTFDPENEVEVDIPEEEAAFVPHWDEKHFRFTFYGDPERQMDRVVELMTRFGLACYNAGTRTMYSETEPPPSFQGTPEEQQRSTALDAAMNDAVRQAHAASSDPKERLKMVTEMMKSGQFKGLLDDQMKQAEGKKKRKK